MVDEGYGKEMEGLCVMVCRSDGWGTRLLCC